MDHFPSRMTTFSIEIETESTYPQVNWETIGNNCQSNRHLIDQPISRLGVDWQHFFTAIDTRPPDLRVDWQHFSLDSRLTCGSVDWVWIALRNVINRLPIDLGVSRSGVLWLADRSIECQLLPKNGVNCCQKMVPIESAVTRSGVDSCEKCCQSTRNRLECRPSKCP